MSYIILDQNIRETDRQTDRQTYRQRNIYIYYTNLPTGLRTINLTTEFIASVLYKIKSMDYEQSVQQ